LLRYTLPSRYCDSDNLIVKAFALYAEPCIFSLMKLTLRATKQEASDNRNNDFPYRKELEALQKRHPEFRIDYVVNPERIDEKSIPKLVPDMDNPTFYVSGPEPMVKSLEKTLKKLNVPKKRIKTDFFPGYHWP